MILVDTSAWIDYFRGELPQLGPVLARGEVYAHPWVIAELALGTMRDRAIRLAALDQLDEAVVASVEEVRQIVERHRLHGRGIGLVDAQLVGSALLTSCSLWTLDRRLRSAAADSGVSVVEVDRPSS